MKWCERCEASCNESGNGQTWYCLSCELLHVDVSNDSDVIIL